MTTLKECLGRLEDPDYCGSGLHQELMWTTDCYERVSLDHSFLNAFAKGMVKYFSKVYLIPVYPASITSYADGGAAGGCVRLLHCHYGMELHDNDWEVIGNIGREYAAGFWPDDWQPGTVDWTPSEPSEWRLSGFRSF